MNCFRRKMLTSGFHIIVSDGDASQLVERRCYRDACNDMGKFFWWCSRHSRSIADVPIEIGKAVISSTLENVPDALPSCPRPCWDVPVACDDIEPGLLTYCYKVRVTICILSFEWSSKNNALKRHPLITTPVILHLNKL